MSDIIKFTDNLFDNISEVIINARSNVQKSVNYELTAMHWHIGRLIKEDINQSDRARYGAQIVDELSQRLSALYGRGFGRRNLFSMIKFWGVLTI